jgi:hypothetical protein
LVYAPTIFSEFLWDDQQFVLENIYLRSWKFIPEIFAKSITDGAGDTSNLYRPLQSVTHLFDISIWGFTPWGHHLTNLLLAGLVAVLLYKVLLKFVDSEILAAFLSLIYICHPMQAEIIGYVSGRGDMLMLIFLFASVLNFPKKPALTALFVALGVFSKENGLLIAPFLIMYNIYGLRQKAMEKFYWWQHGVFVSINVIYLALRITVLNFVNSLNFFNAENVFTQNFHYRLFTYFTTLSKGLSLWIWPYDLHHERHWEVYATFFHPLVITGLVLILTIIGVGIFGWKKKPILALGAAWLLLATIPTSNLIIMINAIIYDHWFVVPGLGFIFMLLATKNYIYKSPNTKKMALILGSLILMAEVPYTEVQNQVWKNPISLYEHILRYEPNSSKILNNLAMHLSDEGQNQRAKEYYLKAISLNDTYPQTHHNLGMIYFHEKDYQNALKEFDIALKMFPHFYQSMTQKGLIYLEQKNYSGAIEQFEKSLSVHPSTAGFRGLVQAYEANGQTEKARETFEKAKQLGFAK